MMKSLRRNLFAVGCCVATSRSTNVFFRNNDAAVLDQAGLYFYAAENDEINNDEAGKYHDAELGSLRVNARIVDGVSEVTMVQEFRASSTDSFFGDDQSGKKYEAFYQVPIDFKAAVTEFRAEIGDRVVEAVVKSREEALRDFEEAENSSFLLENIDTDLFRVGVGEIPLEQIVRISLVYVTTLKAETDYESFVLMTAMSPYKHFANLEEKYLNMIHDDVLITLDIIVTADNCEIYSNTHAITIDRAVEGLARVHVTDENPTARDLEIRIAKVKRYPERVYVETSAKYNTTAYMLSCFVGVAPSRPQEKEYVFLVDRSGSMSGNKIKNVKLAMVNIINEMPKENRFNIISFGSEFEVLFSDDGDDDDSRGRSMLTESIATASNNVGFWRADLGDTELLEPLRHVLEADTDYERVVVVLTDGHVCDADSVVEYVRSRRSSGSNARVYAVGIGTRVDRSLVERLSDEGGGKAEFVDGEDSETVEAAVGRQLEHASTELWPRTTIDWNMTDGQQAPFDPLTLRGNDRFTAYYVVPGQETVPDTVVLYSSDGTKLFSVTTFTPLPFSEGSEGGGDFIHKLASRAMIRDLEEGRSSSSDLDASDEDVAQEIVRLGVKYQLASTETSFVAVDNQNWTGFIDVHDGGEEDDDEAPAQSNDEDNNYEDDNLFVSNDDDCNAIQDLQADSESCHQNILSDFGNFTSNFCFRLDLPLLLLSPLIKRLAKLYSHFACEEYDDKSAPSCGPTFVPTFAPTSSPTSSFQPTREDNVCTS